MAGVQLRFRLTEYGTLEIGDQHRIYESNEIPLSHRHSVRHVREQLNRETFRVTVKNVEEIVFFGQATINQGVPYNWERSPSFLGFDIWYAGREQFLSLDAVDNIYQRLDLAPVNTVAREVNVRNFDPESYEFPTSKWYDGPVARIIIKNKRGTSARHENPAVMAEDEEPGALESPATLARHLATDRRLSRVVSSLET